MDPLTPAPMRLPSPTDELGFTTRDAWVMFPPTAPGDHEEKVCGVIGIYESIACPLMVRAPAKLEVLVFVEVKFVTVVVPSESEVGPVMEPLTTRFPEIVAFPPMERVPDDVREPLPIVRFPDAKFRPLLTVMLFRVLMGWETATCRMLACAVDWAFED